MQREPKPSEGQICEDGIRYVLMRPDVLMGIAHELGAQSLQAFLNALERSAFRHVKASFSHYQTSNPLTGHDFITSVSQIAGRLGWGSWSSSQPREDMMVIEVRNSPFAFGFGKSDRPVCAPIVGILAAAVVTAGRTAEVSEEACEAQGASCCRFEVRSIKKQMARK